MSQRWLKRNYEDIVKNGALEVQITDTDKFDDDIKDLFVSY